MAMLAEPRRKTKWTLNPRGKLWSEDSNKFGQKMLEKMGWKAGKGLGANEQGITAPVHVIVKSDNAGVGFDGKDTEWCQHQSHFDEILKSLCQNTSEVDRAPPRSLEERSKASKNRLHYQKFTRGKDVSKYSTKDLGCILGVRGDKPAEGSIGNSQIVEDIITNNSFGVKTIVGGLINDYLEQKQGSKCLGQKAEMKGVEEECRGGKKRKAESDTECKDSVEVSVDSEGTRGPCDMKEMGKRRKKRKINSEEEGESSENLPVLPICVDESEHMEVGDAVCVVDEEKSEKKNGANKRKRKDLNSALVDLDLPGDGSSTGDGLEKEGHPELVVGKKKKKGKNSKKVMGEEIHETLSLEELGTNTVNNEHDISQNDTVDENANWQHDGSQKKKKDSKGERFSEGQESSLVDESRNALGREGIKKCNRVKSSAIEEVEKCDSICNADEDIRLSQIHSSEIISVEEQVVVNEELCLRKASILRKARRQMKKLSKKRESGRESEIEPDASSYRILDRKEYDNNILKASGQMFPGANLVTIKGYGAGLQVPSKEKSP
ncbi:PIN2/TERF1-interacting telomerase inhibitor 1-like [Hetaerina americana]|uniref:PIN2/TERF1-interacting telomerase inhibitor 1-like n=1 Tax=Hetaerina americana TaxID=62018 RepID=UPI003A7F2863